MNWNTLIYAGMAAAAAGFMTALAVFIELKIPETAVYLLGTRQKKETALIREREAELRDETAGKPEQEKTKETLFAVQRRIISVWPEGISDTETDGRRGPERRTAPLS